MWVHNGEVIDLYLQSDVCLGNVLAEVVGTILLLLQMLLCAVQSLEESDDVLLICLGSSSKARLVNSVVDQVISPLVSFLNGVLQVLRVGLNIAILLLNDVVKLTLSASFFSHNN